MVGWDGLAASVATKILHKKRSRLIPILDNEAIFGTYVNPRWPKQRAPRESIYARCRVREALEWTATDLTRPENTTPWERLVKVEPKRSRIELFDMVWWVHFRRIQPVSTRAQVWPGA